MSIISVQSLIKFQDIFSAELGEQVTAIYSGGICFMIRDEYLEHAIERYEQFPSTIELMRDAHYAFRQEGSTLVMLKNRDDFNMLKANLARHGYECETGKFELQRQAIR